MQSRVRCKLEPSTVRVLRSRPALNHPPWQHPLASRNQSMAPQLGSDYITQGKKGDPRYLEYPSLLAGIKLACCRDLFCRLLNETGERFACLSTLHNGQGCALRRARATTDLVRAKKGRCLKIVCWLLEFVGGWLQVGWGGVEKGWPAPMS